MKKVITVLLMISVLLLSCAPVRGEQRGLDYWTKKVRESRGEEEEEPDDPEPVEPDENDPDMDEEISPWKNVSDWKREHGYSFPVYGDTVADLSPVSDFLTALEDHGIYLKLRELNITNQDEYDWIYSEIGDSLYFRYISYLDGSKSSLYLEVPRSYRPRDEAFALMIVSFLSIDMQEAEELYSAIQYNVIDQWGVIETDEYTLMYYEPRYQNGDLAGFVSFSVEKSLR